MASPIGAGQNCELVKGFFCCVIKNQLNDGELRGWKIGNSVEAALKACEVQ